MTKKQEKEQAKKYLLEQLFDDQGNLKKIHVIFKYVSPSGMTRVFQVYTQDWLNLSWNFSQLLGWGWDKNRLGIKVTGCGMDESIHMWDCVLWHFYPGGWKERPEDWQNLLKFHN